MARYSLTQLGHYTGASGWTPAAEIRSSVLARCAVVELSVQLLATNVAPVFQVGRPAAAGVGPIAAVAFHPEDPADPTSFTTMACAWGAAPTQPANALRLAGAVSGIGAGAIWFWPRGLKIAANSSLVVGQAAPNVFAWQTGAVIEE